MFLCCVFIQVTINHNNVDSRIERIDLNIKRLFQQNAFVYWLRMMTSSNGNIFRVTGPLCGEFTDHRWIPLTTQQGQWRGALMFSLICVWINDWANNREAGELRRHRGNYDVTVMDSTRARSFHSRGGVTKAPLKILISQNHYLNLLIMIILTGAAKRWRQISNINVKFLNAFGYQCLKKNWANNRTQETVWHEQCIVYNNYQLINNIFG